MSSFAGYSASGLAISEGKPLTTTLVKERVPMLEATATATTTLTFLYVLPTIVPAHASKHTIRQVELSMLKIVRYICKIQEGRSLKGNMETEFMQVKQNPTGTTSVSV